MLLMEKCVTSQTLFVLVYNMVMRMNGKTQLLKYILELSGDC